MPERPLVSVIVPTKDSAELLKDCLISLCMCRNFYPNMEIIVVDNFSEDDTLMIAKVFTDKVYRYGPERAAQMNYGISKATGEYIYVTGSDMTRDADFISQAVDKLQDDYDAIYMSVLTDKKRVKHYWGRVKALEREAYIGTPVESARFFKKDVFIEAGAFDERLVGVEEDLQVRLDALGFKTGRINAREYHLHEETNLIRVFIKYFYYGKFARYYIRTHGVKGVAFLSPLRMAFIKNWRMLSRHPFLTIGMIVYKIVQYIAGSIGALRG